MQIGWKYKTRWGWVAIVAVRDGWDIIFDDENLGYYHREDIALEELVNGHTSLPSCGVDPSEMGIADDLSLWRPVFSDR